MRYREKIVLLALLCSCRPALQGELKENEANDMVAALLAEGVEAEKAPAADSHFVVRVARRDFQNAWQILRERGLPRRRHPGLGAAYRERSLVPGRTEEQAVLAGALQEELAETLESIDGVVSARVHLTLTLEGERGRAPPPPSASILLIVSRRPAPVEERQVQKLVAHAVSGLDAERVSVVMLEAENKPRSGLPRPGREATASLWTVGGLLLLLAAGGAIFALLRKHRGAAVKERLLP